MFTAHERVPLLRTRLLRPSDHSNDIIQLLDIDINSLRQIRSWSRPGCWEKLSASDATGNTFKYLGVISTAQERDHICHLSELRMEITFFFDEKNTSSTVFKTGRGRREKKHACRWWTNPRPTSKALMHHYITKRGSNQIEYNTSLHTYSPWRCTI